MDAAEQALRDGGFGPAMVSALRGLSSEPPSVAVLERCRHAALDWLAVSIAGSTEPSARISLEVALAEGGDPAARVLGTSHRVTARQAALVVGIAGHSMDYDDMGVGGHPSVVTLPAVFAVAEELGVDGRTTVEAMLYGYEAIRIVATAVGGASYARGFHLTSHFGVFGAAIAVGRLLDLDDAQLQRAAGIAGSLASGLKAGFGTMTKHLHAGNAAAAGVLAARLAQRGFTGPVDVVESRQGLAGVHDTAGQTFDPARALDGGQRLGVETLKFKLHAACGGTHSAIEGGRAILAQRSFTASDIEEVEVIINDQSPAAILEPRTAVESMFSVRHAVTVALAGLSTGPSAFTDESVQDPQLVALRDRVVIKPDNDRVPTIGSPTPVTVRLKSGEVLTAEVNPFVPTPDAELPRQWDELRTKFHEIVAPIVGDRRCGELVDLVRTIDTLDSIREIADRAVPS